MEWIKNRKKRLLVAVLCGMLAAVPVNSGSLPLGTEPVLTAWWGTMYPDFCFAEKPQKSETESSRPQVKISFWLAKVFDW